MSRPYTVTFIHFDTEDEAPTDVSVNGIRYEPGRIRRSMRVETVGPFKTKPQAQKYAKRFDGYATHTLIKELEDPTDE